MYRSFLCPWGGAAYLIMMMNQGDVFLTSLLLLLLVLAFCLFRQAFLSSCLFSRALFAPPAQDFDNVWYLLTNTYGLW